MVYFEKSHPAPSCLATEAQKTNGRYDCGDVLDRLNVDFKNKCYLCEQKAPTSINVEHFVPHQGNLKLKFDWNNLFYSCGYCNNVKLAKYTPLLDCTDSMISIQERLVLRLISFPKESVEVEIQIPFRQDNATEQTAALLDAIHNTVHTNNKRLASANLRSKILEEAEQLQKYIKRYFKYIDDEGQRLYYFNKIIGEHLSRAAPFTAIKRQIIYDNENWRAVFEPHFD